MYALLRDARPLLLDLDGPDSFDITPWAHRVRLVAASHDGAWVIPVLGEIEAPRAVLIQPRGASAWVGHLTDPELTRALDIWFGHPT